MQLKRAKIRFQIDSGSSVNIIPRRYIGNIPVKKTSRSLRMWNKANVQPIGTVRLTLFNPANSQQYAVPFVVVEQELQPLIGKRAAEEMNLIRVNYDNFVVAAVDTTTTKYTDVISDTIGTLPGTVKLQIDEAANPVALPAHRLPVHLKSRVKKELDAMVNRGILAPVDEPTAWVSQMVVTTKKSGEPRICINPKALNEVLKREHYMMPTIDDVLPNLSRAKVFSKIDLRNGYWHLKLDEESTNLLAFQTPFGCYKWLRLPFGLSTSGEIFQKRLHQALEGLSNVMCVADDIIIYGSGDNDKTVLQDHDRNLHRVLERCQSLGIRLNADKCEFRTRKISFLGHLITSEGLCADPNKIKAIIEMP